MIVSEDFFRKAYGKAYIEDASSWKPAAHSGGPVTLTEEQQSMVKLALAGKNVFVDACVGSGKTTSIQALCNVMSGKKILYLTYSKLLKVEARKKITSRGNITVTNYHGLAWSILNAHGIRAGLSEMVQMAARGNYPMPKYDLMVIDEYQDLEVDTAELVMRIKNENPGIQIVAVGDMKQKIHDKTTLDVMPFIMQLLGDHEQVAFTRCFRLCAEHASRLERIWEKHIRGVNENCKVALMTTDEAVEFIGRQNPADLLCLGQRNRALADALNELEELHPDKFNKRTVYASIRDQDAGYMEPKEDAAIFTTYDSSKGLEREICVLFDFVPSYWHARAYQPCVNIEILRNIFMVAASRGRGLIIFVEDNEAVIDDEYINKHMSGGKAFDVFNISEMFDFKYIEDVEKCYSHLITKKLPVADDGRIMVDTHDHMIDLSPCIGHWQEAMYFDGYDIAHEFDLFQEAHPDKRIFYDPNEPLEMQVLRLTAVQTSQNRYIRQVRLPLVSKEQEALIRTRLAELVSSGEEVQKHCRMEISHMQGSFSIVGACDVIRPDEVIELKFVDELMHTHFLQCACYMAAFGINKGLLWNIRDNTRYEIRIDDVKRFMSDVIYTITKHRVANYNIAGRNAEKGIKKAHKTTISKGSGRSKRRVKRKLV